MEELNENTKKSDEENSQEEDEHDEETDHTKGNLFEPDTKSDNMKDLKSLDFNSADDVRQTLKAVFTSKMPNFIEHTEDIYIDLNNDCGSDLLQENLKQGPTSVFQIGNSELKNNINNLQTKRSSELRSFKKCGIPKRRGRPLKAGPSKTIKKQNISTLYIGKLSNIVFSRRCYESDSDIESVFSN